MTKRTEQESVTRDSFVRNRRPRRLCAFVLPILLFAAGCGSGLRAGNADSLTGGVALEMFVSDEKTSHALYIVEPVGSVSFGGGLAAMDRTTTWTGQLNAAEVAEFRSLLEEHGWFAGPPGYDDSLANPASSSYDSMDRRRHEIDFACPGGRWSMDRHGAGPRVAPVRRFLERMSMRRNQAVFDQLPDATKDE